MATEKESSSKTTAIEEQKERVSRVTFRLSKDETLMIDTKARLSGISRSELIRRAALNLAVHSVIDEQMVIELKRLGALMKYQYPKESNWTSEEKREYWQLMTKLNQLALLIRERV